MMHDCDAYCHKNQNSQLRSIRCWIKHITWSTFIAPLSESHRAKSNILLCKCNRARSWPTSFSIRGFAMHCSSWALLFWMLKGTNIELTMPTSRLLEQRHLAPFAWHLYRQSKNMDPSYHRRVIENQKWFLASTPSKVEKACWVSNERYAKVAH